MGPSPPSCLLSQVTFGILAASWCHFEGTLQPVMSNVENVLVSAAPAWVRSRACSAEASGSSASVCSPGVIPGLAGDSSAVLGVVWLPRCTSQKHPGIHGTAVCTQTTGGSGTCLQKAVWWLAGRVTPGNLALQLAGTNPGC